MHFVASLYISISESETLTILKFNYFVSFVVKLCPKKFISNYKLKIHTMRHMNVKPFECPTCGLRKTTNKELKAHLNFHSKEITYPCKECPRVFPSYGKWRIVIDFVLNVLSDIGGFVHSRCNQSTCANPSSQS